ncbi:MAG: hypothetical protein D6701_00160 [Gemmatimonadetes bacterium]|nr:MAG: hypothetical protein D6701_00160 [Gemmatimonadota bacterium]
MNPLLQPAGGRRLSDGSDALAELSFDWAPAERIAFSVTPRVQISRPDEGEDAEDVFLQNLQANLALGNLILSVGRDYVAWAQGVHGGLAFGGNARGLDRVELRTDRPFAFPGFLGFLGSGAASLFVSRLEEDRDIPHSYLVGYRLGLRPGRAFEFGMMALVHSGGEGAPESSLGDRVLENIIFLEPFIDAQASNRQLGFDIRIRFPGERGAELYSEYLLEDPPANLSVYKKWLWHDVGWLVGLWFPRLDEAGRTDLRLEGRHTGLRLGRHTQFTSGMSLDGQLLGDGLGPDGNGAYLTLGTLLGSDLRLELHGAAERRSRDRYRFGPPPGGGPNRFERIESFAKEDRARVLATLWYRPVDRPISLRVRGGFEWADDFAFVAGDRRRAFSLWVTGFWRP